MEEELLTPAEVAGRLKSSKTMVYKLLQTGKLRVVRIGSLLRVKRSELERYIHERDEGSNSNNKPGA